MLKRVSVLLVLFFFLLGGLAQAWEIENYKVDVNLAKDSSFVVTEEIEADFGREAKHGIYRDIPTTYNDENGRPCNLKFQVTGVSDERQRPWEYREVNNQNFRRLIIGSPNRIVSGRQRYFITYRVSGATLFLPEHDELYWNAVGSRWDVKINHVQVAVHLPEPVAKESLKIKTYTGAQGSTTTNARSEIVDDRLVTFAGENYSPYEGFTIVVGLPKGILTQPPAENPVTSVRQYDSSYAATPTAGPWFLILPVIVFAFMLNLWQSFGKDPQLNKSIVVEYKAPGGLSPAEMGTVMDSRVDSRDITATIIDLAVRGYLKIIQKEGLLWSKDYSLLMLKDYEDDARLKLYEKKVLRGIFGQAFQQSEVRLSDLTDKFSANLSGIEKSIRTELESRKYLARDSAATIFLYTLLGGIVGLLGLFTITYDPFLMLSLVLSGVIIFLFGLVMPKRTVEGTEILAKVLGFKEFLQRTEKDQIQRAEQQDVFERMLPYAICLGMSTKWATKFDGLYTQPPQWFAGAYGSAFVYDHFVHDLNNSLNTMGASFYSSPKTVSSGGGFSGGSSGGGFGGGGGGSW